MRISEDPDNNAAQSQTAVSLMSEQLTAVVLIRAVRESKEAGIGCVKEVLVGYRASGRDLSQAARLIGWMRASSSLGRNRSKLSRSAGNKPATAIVFPSERGAPSRVMR